jgi:hypothetical protein
MGTLRTSFALLYVATTKTRSHTHQQSKKISQQKVSIKNITYNKSREMKCTFQED